MYLTLMLGRRTSNQGYSIFRLDWGDGTPLEHTTKPKILEGTTLLEHVYKEEKDSIPSKVWLWHLMVLTSVVGKSLKQIFY